ncbi:MAG: pyrroline-5-carboxylate reductase [Rhodospirillales bacterium]|nr:MAG: pyrroline-5-carboxylate reductase [Rhodospirillales bacterium]
MGQALLSGWIDRGIAPSAVAVVEPETGTREAVATRFPGVSVLPEPGLLDPRFRPDVIVLAVKPQVMDGVVAGYRGFAGAGTVVLSIAAGRTVASFRRVLGDQAQVVRAMPNTPASVHRGISVACAGPAVTAAQRALCTGLLEAVGGVIWIEDESLMDAVTAVSGSGPAYVFLLTEALAAAGIEAGLPEAMAGRLARETVIGAASLLSATDASPDVLRQGVTSPGGTTEAALGVLMAEPGGLRALLVAAVRAAAERSRTLAS